MSGSDKETMTMSNARTDEQRRIMEQIQKDGVCPFCREHFEKYHPKPILRESPHWIVAENGFPYKGTRIHMLFVYKKHINSISEVSAEGFLELLEHIKWVNEEYCIQGGALIWRYGDPQYNGSSVHHLHAQIVSGEIDSPSSEPIRVKVGFKKK